MAEAAELLEIMALSIGENGIRAGCANSLHFSRDFKKEYSAAPIIVLISYLTMQRLPRLIMRECPRMKNVRQG